MLFRKTLVILLAVLAGLLLDIRYINAMDTIDKTHMKTETEIRAEITKIEADNTKLEKDHPNMWHKYTYPQNTNDPGADLNAKLDWMLSATKDEKYRKLYNERINYINTLLWVLGENE